MSASNKKFFILKFAKNTPFYPKIKNWHFRVKSDIWGLDCEKNHRESRICYQEMHILLDVPSTDYSLSLGNVLGIFSLRKGWPLFLAILVCLLLKGRLSLHDFVCDRVLFSLNKEFFQYYETTSFWGKKSFFGNSRFSWNLLVWRCWCSWHFCSWTCCEHVELIETGLRLPVLPMK